MKILLLLCIGIFEVALATNITCSNGHWGPPACQNICGECYISVTDTTKQMCDPVDGKCPVGGCLGGYGGERCDEAHCDGGCGSGQCLAPGYCTLCDNISKVSPNCEDIRLRGLVGSLIAFVVIGSSVTLCGLGSVWYKRRKTPPVAL